MPEKSNNRQWGPSNPASGKDGFSVASPKKKGKGTDGGELTQTDNFFIKRLTLSSTHDNIINESILRKGDQIAAFTVVKPLSHSGFCELYLVVNRLTRKLYALKLLPPLLSALDDEFDARFESIGAKMRNSQIYPGIIYTHDIGKDRSYYYIVSDYKETVESKTFSLKDRLNRQVKLSKKRVKSIALQICTAMGQAHSHKDGRFVHSDLKPSNILLDKDQKIVITDFKILDIIGYNYFIGLVKDAIKNRISMPIQSNVALHSPKAPSYKDTKLDKEVEDTHKAILLKSAPNPLSAMSALGTQYIKNMLHPPQSSSSYETARTAASPDKNEAEAALETYDCMSPEQKAGEPATIRSNIYSFGVILYWMLTGVRISGSWNLPSNSGCSRSWDPILFRCLQLDPENRYESFEELSKAISNVDEKRLTLPVIATVSIAMLMGAFLIFSIKNLDLGKNMEFFKFKKKMASFFDSSSSNKNISTVALTLDIKPAGSSLKIYNKDKLLAVIIAQSSGQSNIDLEPGKYVIEATRNGHKKIKKEIIVNAENTLFTFNLEIENPVKVKKYIYLKNLKEPKTGFPWIIPSVPIELLPIATGSFIIGSSIADPYRKPDEITRRTVRIPRPFWMGKYEVTQKQYEEIMWKNPSYFKEQPDATPVNRVSWDMAMIFCEKLTKKEREAGRLPDGYVYRLPLEKEWEYCCRAGSKDSYFFGEDKRLLKEFAWHHDNSDEMSQSIGKKNANAWGFFDILGNVAEWTLDSFGNDLPAMVISDGQKAPGAEYILRGGSWMSLPGHLRSASRARIDSSGFADRHTGFRIALAPEAPSSK